MMRAFADPEEDPMSRSERIASIAQRYVDAQRFAGIE